MHAVWFLLREGSAYGFHRWSFSLLWCCLYSFTVIYCTCECDLVLSPVSAPSELKSTGSLRDSWHNLCRCIKSSGTTDMRQVLIYFQTLLQRLVLQKRKLGTIFDDIDKGLEQQYLGVKQWKHIEINMLWKTTKLFVHSMSKYSFKLGKVNTFSQERNMIVYRIQNIICLPSTSGETGPQQTCTH